MGEAFVTELLEAIRRVVPPDVVVDASTTVDRTTLDSLGLLETFVHLEELSGRRFDEDTVRVLSLDGGYDPSITIAALAALLERCETETRAVAAGHPDHGGHP
jgi:acyl carrier protein